MSSETVREYHRDTEHRPGRPAPSGPFDPANEPTKTKHYPGIGVEPLPGRWGDPGRAAADVLSGDGGDGRVEVTRETVSRLLFLSDGVTRTMQRGGTRRHFRAAPSAGALYPVEVYLVCGDLPDLPAGIYHFQPEEHGLHRLRDGDARAALAEATADDEVAGSPVSLVLTGIAWRTSWKYGPRGYRHLYWDAGVIVANSLAAASSAGWPARVLAGFVDAQVSRLLDLGDHLPLTEWPLAVVAVGEPAEPASEVGIEPLGLAVDPLSRHHPAQPRIEEVHDATTLPAPTAVGSWRRRDADLAAAASPPLSPPASDGATVDEIILRRGSTRAFAEESVPEAAVTWGLPSAMRPVPGDLGGEDTTPVTPFLAIHAVDGFDPGGYRWRPSGWERVVDDQPRAATAHLCLDQELGGTAAFTVFLTTDLETLLEAAGPRAYRCAQLAAGVAAGRLQLAAFTLGAGGTGLTFYDDEIRRHFATSGDPLLVSAIGMPGYRPRPGRLPAD